MTDEISEIYGNMMNYGGLLRYPGCGYFMIFHDIFNFSYIFIMFTVCVSYVFLSLVPYQRGALKLCPGTTQTRDLRWDDATNSWQGAGVKAKQNNLTSQII